MPRHLRVEYLGAIYHVMNRGNQRADIFKDDQNRLRFLETLAETCAQTNGQLHARCFVRNHFHLVLETSETQPRRRNEMVRESVRGGRDFQ